MAADGRAEFDPKEIASAAFPTAFRGYEQEAVRHYLTRLAAAVGRAQQLGILGSVDYDENSAHIRAAEAEREAAELRAKVAELEALIESGLGAAGDVGDDDLSGDGIDEDEGVADARAGDDAGGDQVDGQEGGRASSAIDEAELIELLGQETANILATARTAATDITKRADDEAALIKNEAALSARTIRDEAEEELAGARVEAARILASAGEDAAQIQERLEAEARRAYDDARDEADRIVTEASAKVEGDLAAARQRALQIVADAEGTREEVLGDLVRRRRVHRSQLSRLSEARDRLARSLAAARSGLDEVATTIDVATGDGSIDLVDPEPAAEALDDDTVAELIARLDKARADAPAPSASGAGVHASLAQNGSADDTVRLKARSEDSADVSGDDADVVAADGGVLVLEADVESQPLPESQPAPESQPENNADADLVDGTVENGSYREQAAEAIDELKGPIDGDRLLDQLGFTDERVLGTDDGAMSRLEARGDLPRNTPFAGRLPAVFEQRDLAMTKATPGFRRRLKRAVNDDQSDVLDRLRAGRKEIEIEELPPLEEQLTGYIAALTPALRDVVVAGGQVLGCDDAPLPAVDNLCLQLAKHIVDNLRLPTIDVVETSPGLDRETVLDPVRAIYRDFRNSLLPDLIDDALHEAFALGVFHAIEQPEDVLWVVDPRLDPDPICEDNSASPPLPKGTEFPSGHTRPLSMPGCRCLAVPVS